MKWAKKGTAGLAGAIIITLWPPKPVLPAQELTFADVLHRAIENSPAVQKFENQARAREGLAEQAEVAPNPVVGAAAGNRIRLFRLAQEVEYPGKRHARAGAAVEDLEAARLATRQAMLDVESAAGAAFFDALWARENVRLLQENLRVNQKIADAAAYNAKQGFGSRFDVVKGDIEVVRAKRLLLAAQRQLLDAESNLKIMLGIDPADSLYLRGNLARPVFEPPAGLDSLLARADEHNPAVLLELHRTRAAAFRLTAARLANKPNLDFELSGGVDDHEAAVELNISLPVALWDQKSGARAAAEFDHRSRQNAVAEVRVILRQNLSATWHAWQTASASAGLFEASLLQEARNTAAAAQTAFEGGGFRLLDLVDARRTYIEAALEYNDNLRAQRRAEIDMRVTTGYSFIAGTL